MAHKVWIIGESAGKHVIELEHGFWSGNRVIKVDGQEIHRSKKLWDTGTEHRFKVASQDCIVRIRNSPFSFQYELFVDGKLV